MAQQRKLALVNDLTGYGRCSLAVELPIISALKVQACVLPTAILSVHTGFPSYYLDDYTDRMTPYIESWQTNHVTFDGISTGFLGSARQIDIVLDFITKFKQGATKVIVDPVMGDHGKIYASYTPVMCDEMGRLLGYADVVTPNITEGCQLTGIPYKPEDAWTDRELTEMAEALTAKGPAHVVITGIHRGRQIGNFVYERGQEPQWVWHAVVGHDRSGTGDVFAAIVSAGVVKGEPLVQSVTKAADFIATCLAYTETLGTPPQCGLAFEEFLTTLR